MYTTRDVLMPGTGFLKRAARIGLPIIFQNFIMFALNMMDVILLQGLGDTAVAAVSVANQSNLIVNLAIFGVCSGSTILMAQYRGMDDYESMRKTVCIALAIIGAITISVEAFMMVKPRTVMGLMTDEPQLIAPGAGYLRTVAISFVFSGFSMVFATLLRCNEKTGLPLIAAVTALSLNTLLNYLLIYGKAGLPAMGAAGAAVATIISRIVEFSIILFFVYVDKKIRPRLKDFKAINGKFIKAFAIITTPVIINELVWGLGNTIYNAIYGRMGEVTVAAMSVATVLQQTFAVVAIGCGHITTIIVGKELGEENFDRAKMYASTLSLWAVVLGVVTTVVMSGLGPVFARSVFTNLSEEAITAAISFIIMFAVYMPLSSFNYANIVGTLRSGGDSVWAAVLDVAPMYVYSIPMGIFLGLYLELSPVLVISVMYGEQIIKAILGFMRMKQYKWVRKIGR